MEFSTLGGCCKTFRCVDLTYLANRSLAAAPATTASEPKAEEPAEPEPSPPQPFEYPFDD